MFALDRSPHRQPWLKLRRARDLPDYWSLSVEIGCQRHPHQYMRERWGGIKPHTRRAAADEEDKTCVRFRSWLLLVLSK